MDNLDESTSSTEIEKDLSRDLFVELSRLALHYKKALHSLNEQNGLTPNELGLMMIIYCHPEMDTAHQLVKKLGTTKGLASRSVDGLVKKGLVKTVHDEKDKRVIHITLCDNASAICQEAFKCQKDFYTKAMNGIAREDVEYALSIIEKMVENIL